MASGSRGRSGRSSRIKRSRGSKDATWIGIDRRIVIGGAILLILIFLFVPMYSAAKVVEMTDTKIVTVEKRMPEIVTEDVPTKVYVGYMQALGQSYGGSGRRYQIDASDEMVDFQQVNGPDGSLTITLTNASGKSTVYRYIGTCDLTKTGEVNIRTTFTRMKTVSIQEPQQIIKEEVIPIKVNLIQLLSYNLREQ